MHRKYMRDRSRRVIREERAGGRWTEYEYDQRGRLARSSFSDGTIEAFSYDALGRLTEARNATGSVSMEYDEGGRVVKECFSGGLPGDKGTTVENIYDDLGNRIETRTSLGSVVQNSFDEDGLLSRVTAANGGGENWEEKIIRDSEGLKIEKIFSGGIRMTRTYDTYGNVISQKSRSLRQDGYDRRYAWNASGRLQSVIDGITGGRTSYAYDAVGSLMSARYEDGTDDYRMPDTVGNVFRSRDRRDREYGKGGRILRDRHYDFLYDVEGNLILKTLRRGLTQHPNHEVSEESGTHIAWQTGDYAYEWYGNGMLKEVRLPYGKTVCFEYDALGRRTAKLFNGHVFRYLWDGNVMVQEWQYEEKDRPQHSIDEFGRIRMQGEEPVENLVTWVYEEGSYVPVAKIQNGERYTIISDYIGRPVEAYNSYGNVVWQADYDVYGDLRNIKGIRDFIPFRQLGQYEDDETRLYYNRFRYYDPRIGNYISQDPIGLMGNNPTLYGYVGDLNKWADVFGLKCKKSNTAKVYGDKKGRWRNPDGIFAKDPGWPDNFGFVKGKDKIGSLDVGHKVDRFGHPGGNFVADAGTPFTQRSLPSSSIKKEYHQYEVIKSIDNVRSGPAEPWFGQEGLGIQHQLPESIQYYISWIYKRNIIKDERKKHQNFRVSR